MKVIFSSIAICVVLVAAGLVQSQAENPKASIEQVLRTQQEAWNRHDLDAFMQ